MISPARDPLRLFVTPFFYQRFTFSTELLADPVAKQVLVTKWNRCVQQFALAAVTPVTADFIRQLAYAAGRSLDDVMPSHSFAQHITPLDQIADDWKRLPPSAICELVCFTLVWGVLRQGTTASTPREEPAI